jgi:low affinity Fe/Cu permease
MAQNHINKTIKDIKAKLDEILTEYLGIDSQIEAGMHNDPEFFGSYKYYQMQAKKTELGTAHTKLTNTLVAIETYLK